VGRPVGGEDSDDGAFLCRQNYPPYECVVGGGLLGARCNAEFSAGRAGVLGGFGFGRLQGALGEDFEAGVVAVGVFDHAVFEGMEADDGQPACGFETVGQVGEGFGEGFEFFVDRDS